MSTEPEMKLASRTLPRVARRLRRSVGPQAFPVLLAQLEDEEHWSNWQIARLWGLRVWQVRLWRDALTFHSRKLIPELASLKACTPLKAVWPAEEEQDVIAS